MRGFKVQSKTCRKCDTEMEVNFFVYVSDTEKHDKWLDSQDLVEKYCDSCFRDTCKVTVFVEFYCPVCGDYVGSYMECTPYSNAHLLTEIAAKHHG